MNIDITCLIANINWATFGALFGAIATWAGVFFAIYKLNQSRFIDFKLKYEEQKGARKVFWEELRGAYSTYKSTNPSLPTELVELVNTVEMPPDLVCRSGRPLVLWLNENRLKLNTDQRLMLVFAEKIYPPPNGDSSPVTTRTSILANADAFHNARGSLANFWNVWSGIIPINKLADSKVPQINDLIILCWLDITLKQSAPEDRDEGKTDLYRLTNACSTNKNTCSVSQ